MADVEAAAPPVFTEGELPESIQDTLAAIDRKLLPDECARDALVQWVYSWLKQTAPSPRRSSRHLSVSPVANQFVVQALGLLIPFYLVTLRLIGLSWRSMEQLITQAQSALRDENLAASVRLTEQRLAALGARSSAEDLLLKAARETPDALRDTLREILTERLGTYTSRLDETRRAWQRWRDAVTTLRDGVDGFNTLAILVDFGFAGQDPQPLLDTIAPALKKPEELLAQLANLSLEEAPFPEKEAAALMTTLGADLDRAVIELRPERSEGVVDYLVGMRGDLDTPRTVSVYRDAVIHANRSWVPARAQQGDLILHIEREMFRYLFTMREEPFSASAGLRQRLEDYESAGKAGFTRRVAEKFSASRRESTALVGAILDTMRDLLAPRDEASLSHYGALAMKPSSNASARPQARNMRDEPTRRSASGR